MMHASYRIHLYCSSGQKPPSIFIVLLQIFKICPRVFNKRTTNLEWHELVCKWWNKNKNDFWVNYAFKALSNYHCSICGLLCKSAWFKLLIRPWELQNLVSLHFFSSHFPQILSVSSCYIYSRFSNTLSFVLFLLILF